MSDSEQPIPKPRKRAIKRPVEPGVTTALIPGLIPGASPEPVGQAPSAPHYVEQDQPVSRTFLICLAAGFVAACLGLVGNPTIQQIGFIGPILATVVYPLWGRTLGFHKVPSLRERFADNCYYLGFIFTQISLVLGFAPVALWGQEVSSQDVLRFFGVALGASLVGLVARTVLIQTTHSVSENSDIVENEIEQLAMAVAAQSRTVLSEFQGLTKELGKTYQGLSKELAASVNGISSVLVDFRRSLQAGVTTVEVGSAAVTAAADKTAHGIEQEHASLIQAVQRASQAIEQLQSGLHEKVASATDTVQRSAQELSRGAAALTTVAGLADTIAALNQRVADVGGRVGQMDDMVGSTTASFGEAADRNTLAMQQALDQVRGDVLGRAAAFQSELDEAVATFENTLKGFRAELDRISE